LMISPKCFQPEESGDLLRGLPTGFL
jgi:hypothetical protein